MAVVQVISGVIAMYMHCTGDGCSTGDQWCISYVDALYR